MVNLGWDRREKSWINFNSKITVPRTLWKLTVCRANVQKILLCLLCTRTIREQESMYALCSLVPQKQTQQSPLLHIHYHPESIPSRSHVGLLEEYCFLHFYAWRFMRSLKEWACWTSNAILFVVLVHNKHSNT